MYSHILNCIIHNSLNCNDKHRCSWIGAKGFENYRCSWIGAKGQVM